MGDRDRGWRREAPAIAVVAALAVAVVLAVDPRGDFPLNDDWCYAKAVRHFLTDGEIRLVDWGSPALLTQILWGSAFARVFGFSFETLRASTLVLGMVALLCLYGVARELGAARRAALLVVLALLATPVFVLLAHTFMTDVPFLAFSLLAWWLLLRGFRRRSNAELCAGLAVALAATLTRQLGLALFVGFGAAILVRERRGIRRWVLAGAPLVTGFLLLRAYESWLARAGALPRAYDLQWRTLGERFAASPLDVASRWLANVLGMGIEVGLFALPLAALWLVDAEPGTGRRRAIVVVAATLATAGLAASGWLVPFFPNNVLDVGCDAARVAVGPLTLRDACVAAGPGLGVLSAGARVALTWLGVLAFAALLGAALEAAGALRRRAAGIGSLNTASLDNERVRLALLVGAATSYVAVMALIDVFQRYLLFVLPFAFLVPLVAQRERPLHTRSLAVAGALTLASLVWSVGAVGEYLDWNRARWRAFAYLASELGARREEIDGGFEFGGWMNFDARFRHDRRAASWWWVVDDRYAVAFDDVAGFTPRRRFPYSGWFGLVERDVVALERSVGRAVERPAAAERSAGGPTS